MQTIMTIERLKGKAAAMAAKGNEAAAAAIERYAAAMEAQMLAPQGQGQQGQQGMLPQGLPGEMTGASPDMIRSMLGIPPTGEAGRVARPEGVG